MRFPSVITLLFGVCLVVPALAAEPVPRKPQVIPVYSVSPGASGSVSSSASSQRYDIIGGRAVPEGGVFESVRQPLGQFQRAATGRHSAEHRIPRWQARRVTARAGQLPGGRAALGRAAISRTRRRVGAVFVLARDYADDKRPLSRVSLRKPA